MRDSAAGAWTDWQAGVTGLSAEFTGQDGHTYFFRSRARGAAGQAEAYPDAADAKTTVDTQPPTAAILPLPGYLLTAAVPITWTGTDAISGIASYDVQTRSVALDRAADSGWTDWLTSTVLTHTVFAGQDGAIYAFRARARDVAGNVGDFPPATVQNAAFLLSQELATEISVTAASGVLGWAAQVPSRTVAVVPSVLPSPTVPLLPSTPEASGIGAVTSSVEPAPTTAVFAEEASASAVSGIADYLLAFVVLVASFFVRRWAVGRAQHQGRG